MSIATPEGLHLDLVLAGVGSRFVAAVIDWLLRGLLLIAATVVVAVTGGQTGVLIAVMAIAAFFVLFGYDVLFEVMAGGRTPGKRWTGLRVVTTSGDAVGVGASIVRNLLRMVDAIPGVYLVGILVAGLTVKHQRVGDLVAGTVVVRERPKLPAVERTSEEQRWEGDSPWDDDGLDSWDVSAVTAEEIATVRRFLERRRTLDADARRRLAVDLASRLLPRVVGPEAQPSPERFLEDLVAAKSRRG